MTHENAHRPLTCSHLRVEPLENDLVVLFNNGEEMGLVGAEDFVESDPLAQNVVAFVNLDGFPGTPSLLLCLARLTPAQEQSPCSSAPQVASSTRSSPLPRIRSATSSYLSISLSAALLMLCQAQDVFALGLTGSDTDWTVYTETVAGLDYAFFNQRQVLVRPLALAVCSYPPHAEIPHTQRQLPDQWLLATPGRQRAVNCDAGAEHGGTVLCSLLCSALTATAAARH